MALLYFVIHCNSVLTDNEQKKRQATNKEEGDVEKNIWIFRQEFVRILKHYDLKLNLLHISEQH